MTVPEKGEQAPGDVDTTRQLAAAFYQDLRSMARSVRGVQRRNGGGKT